MKITTYYSKKPTLVLISTLLFASSVSAGGLSNLLTGGAAQATNPLTAIEDSIATSLGIKISPIVWSLALSVHNFHKLIKITVCNK